MDDKVDLLQAISEAETIFLSKNDFQANAIMFGKHYAYSPKCNIGMKFSQGGGVVRQYPAFVMGLEIKGVDELPMNADFIVFHTDNISPTYSELLAENKRLKEENEKLEKIKEILEEGESQDEGESQND